MPPVVPLPANRLLTYFSLCMLLALYLSADSITFAAAYANSLGSLVFVVVAWICYTGLFILPAALLTSIASLIGRNIGGGNQAVRLVYTLAVISGAATSLLLYANAKIYALYGIFIDGFVINLLMTRGGIASLGGSSASDLGYGLIATGFVLLHGLMLWLAGSALTQRFLAGWLSARRCAYAIAALLLTTVGVQFTYAYNDAFNKNLLVTFADTVPFFQHTTSRHLFAKLGYQIPRGPKISIKGKLNYPLQPLQTRAPKKPYNLIILTAESWRADMLDADIMPNTWRFAQQARRYTDNFSGGNGTRMGVFSLFTGLPGNYWFTFLQEQRGAALIDVLQQQQYQMSLYTSAMFTYPEFDKTIFSHVPPTQLHQAQENGKPGWQNDRSNVRALLDFIDQRDPNRPFFTFMFFESPHARYHFPPESVIRRPYRDDINYATLSKAELRQDIVPIKNRYINAVHHLDSQFGRIMDYLQQKQLLDSTIVVIVGDHGEEFMEHGYWGHNSTFVNQQIRTPLVIWVPGQAAGQYHGMTSHMDVVPTLMPLLGVQNAAADYSVGQDLLHGFNRVHTYVSDWSHMTYIDSQVKVTQSLGLHNLAGNQVTAANDAVLSAAQVKAQLARTQPMLLEMVNDLHRFLHKKSAV